MRSFDAIRDGFIRAITCGSVNPGASAAVNIEHGAQRGLQQGTRPPGLLRGFIDAVRRPPANAPANTDADTPTQAITIELPQLPPVVVASEAAFPDFSTHGTEEQAGAPDAAAVNQQQADRIRIAEQIHANGERARHLIPEPIIRPPIVLSTSAQTRTSFIDARVPDEKPDVRARLHAKLKDAETLLADGPIVLGEDHTKPAARAVLAELMVSGKVKNLFLELGSLELALFGKSQGGHGKNVSDHLRMKADEGAALSEDDLWIEDLKPVLGWLDNRYNNPIRMVEVIEIAVANRVRVHFADNAATRKPSSVEGMLTRNEEFGGRFKERIEDQFSAGAVILIGGAHTEKRPVGTSQDTSVQSYAGVPADRVMDLSGRDYQ